MGFLKMFGSKEKERSGSVMELPSCPHTALIPRWDSVDDIGHEDRATFYVCESCQQKFEPDEAREMMSTAAEREPIGGDTL